MKLNYHNISHAVFAQRIQHQLQSGGIGKQAALIVQKE